MKLNLNCVQSLSGSLKPFGWEQHNIRKGKAGAITQVSLSISRLNFYWPRHERVLLITNSVNRPEGMFTEQEQTLILLIELWADKLKAKAGTSLIKNFHLYIWFTNRDLYFARVRGENVFYNPHVPYIGRLSYVATWLYYLIFLSLSFEINPCHLNCIVTSVLNV